MAEAPKISAASRRVLDRLLEAAEINAFAGSYTEDENRYNAIVKDYADAVKAMERRIAKLERKD